VPTWDTASSGYDAGKFYTQASDKRGHSIPVKVYFPTTIVSQISKIIAGKYVEEYGTQSDLIRDLVVHGLEKLGRRIALEELQQTISMHIIYSDAVQKRESREVFSAMMEEIRANCQHYLTNGQTESLRGYLIQLFDQAEGVPREHRSEYLAELETQLKLVGGTL
jgi:Arc/MetJ-type ribon-helix-helix transcriptional regulator